MKVAIAGTGNVAKYLIEEVPNFGHDIIVLTRNPKSDRGSIEQRKTDYSVDSLISVLEDCDALVSTVVDFENPAVGTDVHLNMIEALERSKKCKAFIPSEWTANIEDFPEQPMFDTGYNETLIERLEQTTSLRWTLISNSWFVEYVLPPHQRYLGEIGEAWPGNHNDKVFTIYGPGTQPINFASVRDVAKAVGALLNSDEKWERHTYISGDQLTWNELFAVIKRHHPDWTSKNKPLADTIRQLVDNKSPESAFNAYFEILTYSGASSFPKERVERDRAKHFRDIHFRTAEEVLADGLAKPNEVA